MLFRSIREAERRLADARIEAAMKNADEVGKVFLLMQRELAIKEEIARVGEKTVKGIELQGQLEKTRAEIIAENRKDQEKLAKENEKLVEEEFKAIDETLAAREKLKKLKFDALNATEQEVILQREMYELEREFRKVKADGLETTDVEIQLLEKGNQLAKVRADIARETANQTERAVQAEVQKNRVLGPIRGGGTFNDASTATLREILSRNEAAAAEAERRARGAMGIDIARFRNDLSWRYRWEGLVQEPRSIFESRYRLFKFTQRGIQTESIYHSRQGELEQLSGLQWAVTVAMETSDAIAPRLRQAIGWVGSGIVYLLTDVLGRGIGLVGRGVLRGLGNRIYRE